MLFISKQRVMKFQYQTTLSRLIEITIIRYNILVVVKFFLNISIMSNNFKYPETVIQSFISITMQYLTQEKF